MGVLKGLVSDVVFVVPYGDDSSMEVSHGKHYSSWNHELHCNSCRCPHCYHYHHHYQVSPILPFFRDFIMNYFFVVSLEYPMLDPIFLLAGFS